MLFTIYFSCDVQGGENLEFFPQFLNPRLKLVKAGFELQNVNYLNVLQLN